MVKKLTEEMEKRLREPLPAGAVAPHPTKTYLSTIKAIYMFERLNEVFGVGGFTLSGEFIERVDKMVVIKGTLTIPEYDMTFSNFGGNDNKDLGDAYKGALTDAFTKIAGQHLEVGMYVFKGMGSLPEKPNLVTNTQLNDLYEMIKPLDYEKIEKWFQKEKISKLEELTQQRGAHIIEAYRKKTA